MCFGGVVGDLVKVYSLSFARRKLSATRPHPGRLMLKCSLFGTATPWPLRRQRGNDGFVAGVYEGIAVGDDRLAVALEHHHDKRVLTLRHVAQALSS